MTGSWTWSGRSALAVLAVMLIGGSGVLPSQASDASAQPAARAVAQAAEVRLVSQTPTVPRGGTFEVRVALDGVPADGSVQLVVHDRVRSRSELEASIDGSSLRRVLLPVTTAISALPLAADGSVRLAISLDPAQPVSVRLSAAGAYPVEVIARDASGEPVAETVTHLIAEPNPADESPPLSVAVLAQLGAPPALQPDGTFELDADAAQEQRRFAETLAAAPGVPATLSVVPETLDAMASEEDVDSSAVEALRLAAEDREVLLRPYVDTSLEALAGAGLDEQLDGLLARGRLVLADALGTDPSTSTWVAEPDLAEDGLAALEALGVEHVIVRDEQVEPLTAGTVALSLAKPFALAPPGEDADASELDAFAIDPQIEARLESRDPGPVLGHHLLAELAVLWLEQPGVPRGTVVPIDSSMQPEAVQILLAGLESSRILEPTTVDALFEGLDLIVDAADQPIERSLEPESAATISRSESAAIARGWRRLETFRGIVGLESPRTGPVVDHLLLATASELGDDERREHFEAALTAIGSVTGAITATDRTTITLTARDGTVPLTLRNDSQIPVNVVIHLDSPKLEFPGGESIPITLSEQTTRLDLAVRARASGAFPLIVEVTSPDGQVVLTSTRYTVQSTAVSGAGLVLSIGALLFLVVWWRRHWHKTRRSAKLVDSDHPAAHSRRVNAT